MSVWLYVGLIALTGLERLFELRQSLLNRRWSLERGGTEVGAGHYPTMVALHTGLLVGCVAEVLLLDRVFDARLGIPMLVIAVLCQGLRWWCITTLGPRWNTRVIIVPGLPRITGGPYRTFNHPNYVAVVLEGLALPLIHGAWLTALVFSVANAALLTVRIRVEERALQSLPPGPHEP